LTIALGSGNAANATLNADLVDALPASLRVATAGFRRRTGVHAGKVVAVANGTSVTYPGGRCNSGERRVHVRGQRDLGRGGHVCQYDPVGALQTSIGSNNVATSAALQVLALRRSPRRSSRRRSSPAGPAR
jgi:hypothetical protein